MGANNDSAKLDKISTTAVDQGRRQTERKRSRGGPSKAELLALINELRGDEDLPSEVLYDDPKVKGTFVAIWEQRKAREVAEVEAKKKSFLDKAQAKLGAATPSAVTSPPALTVVKGGALEAPVTAKPAALQVEEPHTGLKHRGIGDALAKIKAKEMAEQVRNVYDRLKVKLPECVLRSCEQALACRGELCRAIIEVQKKRGEEGLPDGYRQTLRHQHDRLQKLIDALNTLLERGYGIEPRGASASPEVYERVRLELVQDPDFSGLLHLPEPPKVETEAERAERESLEQAEAEKREKRKAMVLDITRLLVAAGMEKIAAGCWAESIAKKQIGETARDKLIAAGVGKLLHSGQVARGEGKNGDAIQENIASAELAAKAAGITFEMLEAKAKAHQVIEAQQAAEHHAQAERSRAKIPVETRSVGEQYRAQEAAQAKSKKKGGKKKGGQKGNKGR